LEGKSTATSIRERTGKGDEWQAEFVVVRRRRSPKEFRCIQIQLMEVEGVICHPGSSVSSW